MPDILPAKCETVTWGKLERHCIAFDCIVMAVAYFERKGDVSRPHSVGLGYKSSLDKTTSYFFQVGLLCFCLTAVKETQDCHNITMYDISQIIQIAFI